MFVTCSSGPILRLSTGTRSGSVHPVRSMGRFIATSLLLVLVGIVLGGVLGGLLLLVLLVVVVEVARLPHRRSPFRYITSGQAGYALPLEKLIDSASRSRSHLLSPCFLPFAAGPEPFACVGAGPGGDPAHASGSL